MHARITHPGDARKQRRVQDTAMETMTMYQAMWQEAQEEADEAEEHHSLRLIERRTSTEKETKDA